MNDDVLHILILFRAVCVTGSLRTSRWSLQEGPAWAATGTAWTTGCCPDTSGLTSHS